MTPAEQLKVESLLCRPVRNMQAAAEYAGGLMILNGPGHELWQLYTGHHGVIMNCLLGSLRGRPKGGATWEKT